MRSHQDIAFCPPGSRMGPQGATKEIKRKLSDRQKNLNVFYWILRGLFKTSLFPTRIQDGIPRDSQRDEQENVWQVEKPNDFLLNFMRSYQGFTFSTRIQDGIPRGNQRDKKTKRLTCRKTLASFYWIHEISSGHHFFHKDPGWDPKGQPKQQKGKCLAGRKTLTFFTEF